MFKLVFTDQAHETFDLMKEQITFKWGEGSGNKFDERVYQVLSLIAVSPFIYQALPKYIHIRRAPIHGNSSVFYKVKEDEVIVLFFWDNRQDPIFQY